MTEQELREKLNRMTGEIPPETHRVFLSAALSGKEEKTVKRKITASLILAALLGLAIIGTAYALITSQTAEFFGRHWDQRLGERLQKEGKISRIGESVTFSDIVFTLDEIVYRDRCLYGVGTARPVHENDVLVPNELASDPEWFIKNGEAMALVKKAEASGGKLLTVITMPNRIGVDQGTMLMPGCIGYYDVLNDDGSLTFSFEASDGFAVSEGTEYQIEIESAVNQMDETGNMIEGSKQRETWIIRCTPAVIRNQNEKKSAEPADMILPDLSSCDMIIPDRYQETGTLPVYAAKQTDFTQFVEPSWFNFSGITEQINSEEIRFADHAVLMLSPDGLYYSEYADNNYRESFTGAIIRVLWTNEWDKHRGEFSLEQTALSGITLNEAQNQAEALIKKLGVSSNCYLCVNALDMSLSRIRQMGAIYETAVETGELLADDDWQPYDYGAIPESEEGYYLVYAPQEIDRPDTSGRYRISLYVNSRGIAYANIRNQFVMGNPISTPDRLITPEDALARLMEGISSSIYKEDQAAENIKQIALCYEAVRSNDKTIGMVFVPVWCIRYQDASDVRSGNVHQSEFTSYALVNAVNGTLIDASFR